ncbi:MAG: hypothetical protein WBX07_03325, partial [Rhodoplanes sp.]
MVLPFYFFTESVARIRKARVAPNALDSTFVTVRQLHDPIEGFESGELSPNFFDSLTDQAARFEEWAWATTADLSELCIGDEVWRLLRPSRRASFSAGGELLARRPVRGATFQRFGPHRLLPVKGRGKKNQQ